VAANLTGHDSHGVVRVTRYVEWLRAGEVDALAFKGITPERLSTIDFSKTLEVSGAALFRRAGLPDPSELGHP